MSDVKHSKNCPQIYKVNYLGIPVCAEGTPDPAWNPTPFIPEPQDYERWRGHKRKMFEFMRDMKWHSRDAIVEYVGTKGFTGRISDLRKAGYMVPVDRQNDAGATSYRISEYVGYDTTGKHTCPTCTCKAA
jgi:hypothetical protein